MAGAETRGDRGPSVDGADRFVSEGTRTARIAARFDDPLATKVGWSPLVPGGAAFRTRWMVVESPDRVSLRTMPVQAFLLVAVTLGLLGLAGLLLTLWNEASFRERLGLSALAVAALMLVPVAVSALTPVTFDRSRELFTRPWFPLGPRRARVPLDAIHALQLLRERCRPKPGVTFESYELNVVLRDGRRLSVTDHGNPKRLRVDAHRLSRFLGVPLWDASDVDAPAGAVRWWSRIGLGAVFPPKGRR